MGWDLCLNFLLPVECVFCPIICSFIHYRTETKYSGFFFNLPPRFHCLPTDFLLFRALVPGLLQRICFVSFCRGFVFLPTDFLLFRALVPGLILRICFVLRRHFLCLPIDSLLFPCTSSRSSPAALFCSADSFFFRLTFFIPHSSSRPYPAALFRFAPPFPLSSDSLSFVPRSNSRLSPAGSLLFGVVISDVFTLTFFCVNRPMAFVVDLQTTSCASSCLLSC